MSETLESEGLVALEKEIETFESLRESLEKHHMGKFVVIRDGALVGAYDTLDSAAAVAVQAFGRGPYLIRQVGAPRPHLPVSLLYRQAMSYTQWTGGNAHT